MSEKMIMILFSFIIIIGVLVFYIIPFIRWSLIPRIEVWLYKGNPELCCNNIWCCYDNQGLHLSNYPSFNCAEYANLTEVYEHCGCEHCACHYIIKALNGENITWG